MSRAAAIDIGPVARQISVNIHVEGLRAFGVRCWLLIQVIKLAKAVSPVDLRLIEHDAPPTAYNVSVRSYGSDRILEVGDRHVRIPLREAVYFGEMMLAGWAGEVRNAAVHREQVRGG